MRPRASDVDLSGILAVFIGLFLAALAAAWALLTLIVVRLRSRGDFDARARNATRARHVTREDRPR